MGEQRRRPSSSSSSAVARPSRAKSTSRKTSIADPSDVVVDSDSDSDSDSDEIAKVFSDVYPRSPVVDEAIVAETSVGSVEPSEIAVDPVDGKFPATDAYLGLSSESESAYDVPVSKGGKTRAKTSKCIVAN